MSVLKTDPCEGQNPNMPQNAASIIAPLVVSIPGWFHNKRKKVSRPHIIISYLGKIPKIPKTNPPKGTNIRKSTYATVCN